MTIIYCVNIKLPLSYFKYYLTLQTMSTYNNVITNKSYLSLSAVACLTVSIELNLSIFYICLLPVPKIYDIPFIENDNTFYS